MMINAGCKKWPEVGGGWHHCRPEWIESGVMGGWGLGLFLNPYSSVT